MSAQINLLDPRFFKQRDNLNLGNVAAAAGAVYLLLAVIGGWVWYGLQQRQAAATAAEARLKAARDQFAASTKAIAQRKSDVQLQADLDRAEAALRNRKEIASLLERGALGSSSGFGDVLKGFARQAPDGLWLTGFSIGTGAQDIEIRGAMLDPSALPVYIKRLGAEKVFQGRSFAALTMNRPEPPITQAAAGSAPGGRSAAVAPVAAARSLPIEFILQPRLADGREGGQ